MNKNDLKYQEYKKQKIFKYLIIILSFLTIFLESLALFQVISYVWGLIPFFISYLIKYFNTKNQKIKKEETKKKKLKKS